MALSADKDSEYCLGNFKMLTQCMCCTPHSLVLQLQRLWGVCSIASTLLLLPSLHYKPKTQLAAARMRVTCPPIYCLILGTCIVNLGAALICEQGSTAVKGQARGKTSAYLIALPYSTTL
jgi:hypothetical protein